MAPVALPESTGTDDCFSMSTGPEPRVKKGRKMPEIHSATLPESIPQGNRLFFCENSA